MTQDQIKDAIVKALNKSEQKGWNSSALHILTSLDAQAPITTHEFYHALFLAIEQGLITPKDGKLYPASNSPLAEIMAAANEAIKTLETNTSKVILYNHYNMGNDVSCLNAWACKDSAGQAMVLVEIGEAFCKKLDLYVHEKLTERFPGIVFDVRSEW